MIVTTTSTAEVVAAGAASASFTKSLDPQRVYSVTCENAAWVKHGTGAQTAEADTDANVYVPGGGTVYLAGSAGDTVAVIQDTSAGQAVLALVHDT